MKESWTLLVPLEIESRAIHRICGLTPLRVGLRAQQLRVDTIDNQKGIILAGLAGALDPSLNIGDVIIEAFGDYSWPEFPYPQGKILTQDKLLSTPEEKDRAFAETGACAVDMEAAVVRQKFPGIPMLHIRAISDRADQMMPAITLGWLDADGRPKMRAVTASLAMNPTLIPSVIKIGRNSQIAARAMALAVQTALRCLNV
jgi:hypothetical protein